MPQLDYDDPVEENPWRPVRMVLYILWTIHFFICAFTTIGIVAEFFTKIFDLHIAMNLISIVTIDALYVRQMHLYAMGQLEPRNAAHMHSIQCVMVAFLMLEIFVRSLHEMFGLLVFLFCAISASTFLVQLSVSLGVLYFSVRKTERSIQLPVLNNKV
ncbi:hypothetical protein KCU73_g5827, partial [Aureobasidium melanogenum]